MESTGDPIGGVDMLGRVSDKEPGHSIAILDVQFFEEKDVRLVQRWAEPGARVVMGWGATKRRSAMEGLC